MSPTVRTYKIGPPPPEPKRSNDFAQLAPNFAASLGFVIQHLRLEFEKGILKFRAGLFEGRRSAERQLWLYNSGKTYDGPWLSNAKTGAKSWHFFGQAGDVAWLTSAGEWTWEVPDSHWKRLEEVANEWGLVTGRRWHDVDAPHCQPANVPTTPTALAAQLYAIGGVEAVWKASGNERVHILDHVSKYDGLKCG